MKYLMSIMLWTPRRVKIAVDTELIVNLTIQLSGSDYDYLFSVVVLYNEIACYYSLNGS